MKLRKKETGEIIDIYKGEITLHYNQGRKTIHFKRLEDLEEWEDYEEPKKHCSISQFGDVIDEVDGYMSETIDEMKQIGNYFSSKEEAELAVRKLKAWKRLKDFGCGFILDDHFTVKFEGPDARKIKSAEEQKSLSDAYKLLFGGEE